MKSYERVVLIGKPFLPITISALESALRYFGQDENAEVFQLSDPDSNPAYTVGSMAMTEEVIAGVIARLSQSAARKLLETKNSLREAGLDDMLLSIESALVHGRYEDLSPETDLYDSVASMKGMPCVIVEAYAMMRCGGRIPGILIRVKNARMRDDLSRGVAEDVFLRTFDVRGLVDTDSTNVSDDDINDIFQTLGCFICNATMWRDNNLFETTIHGVFDIIRASMGALGMVTKASVGLVTGIFPPFLSDTGR